MPDTLATLPLGAIRVFEAAARLKSFTRAAEALGIPQAAVSWQVRALEQRLGQALFRRLPREVVLTPAGERLARAAVEAVSLLRAALADITDTDEGILAITTFESIATQWLAPRLGSFHLTHPRIAVRLETSARMADLLRESFDVAVRSGPGDWPGLESHFLFPSHFTPLCTPVLRRALGGLSTPADLLAAPRVGSEIEWKAWFEKAGEVAPNAGSAPRFVGDLQSIEVASALAGHGVALGSPILFAREIAQGRLVQPFEITCSHNQGYWLAYPRDRRRAPKIVAFRDWLMAGIAADPAAARYGQESSSQ